MSFDLPAELESRVARYAEEARVTSDEAVMRLVQDGLQRARSRPKRGSRPPLRTDNPEATIGLFADMPNFVEIIAEVISRRAGRYAGER